MVYCCVIGCKSRSERKLENITFHTFPKNDVAVRTLWIRATGRQGWAPTKFSRICSRHFERNCFRKTQHMTYLNPFSVPTLHLVEQNQIPTAGIPSTSSIEMDIDTKPEQIPLSEKPSTSTEGINIDTRPNQITTTENPLEAIEDMDIDRGSAENLMPVEQGKSATAELVTPRKRKLIKQLNRKTLIAETRKKKLMALRSKYRRLEKKNAELSAVIEQLQTKRYINQEAADLLSSINPKNSQYLKSNKSKFSPEVRAFALNLHFISPNAYNYVRKTFNTCLPHTRTLARWYQTVEGEPGFSTESLAALKLLAKNSNKKLICGISFDEMAIRKAVEWNGKKYFGFVNYGNYMETNALSVAKEVLVFMVTCLNGSWKLPVGYFLTNGVTAEQKASMLKLCVDLITECGLDVFSVTFDGCPANFSMAKLLGCQLDGEEVNPEFSHKGKKMVVFPDPSHMLKLVRNTLGEKSLLTNAEGQTISWKYIKLLVDLQENEGFHLANKVRDAHVNYKKQIMKVKLASQLFSASVADALEFCNKDLEIELFKHSEATVEFIRKFNTLFDVMNSRNLNAYGYKKPIKVDNFENVKTVLDGMFDYIKCLKVGSNNILQTNRKTGFLGFMLCIKSLSFLYHECVKTSKIDFLCTYKMSQDYLEIFFSSIRAKGGFNNNPTATQFKSAYKRMLVHGEIKHLASGNCVPLSDIHILTCTTAPEIVINITTERNRLLKNNSEIQQSLNNEVVISKDHDYLADPSKLTEFAHHVIVYIAGFVIKALERQIKCEQCLSSLYSTEKLEKTLQYRKDKGGLCYPSKGIVRLCEIAEGVYRKNKITSKKDPMNYLLQECVKKCVGLELFTSHDFSDRSVFDSHYYLLIKAVCKKYLNVRIHYATKTMFNREEKVRSQYTKLILFKGQ